MQERGELVHGTVVTTIMSNFGLYKALEKLGIAYEKTAVGDKYVYERMAESGASLGGEQSGHIIFSKYACTGDGVLTALKMMEVMIEKKSPLSKLAADMVPFPQVLVNVRVQDKNRALENEKVRSAIRRAEETLGERGRVLVRASGTEPVLRVMAEADDETLCRACVTEIVGAIEESE